MVIRKGWLSCKQVCCRYPPGVFSETFRPPHFRSPSCLPTKKRGEFRISQGFSCAPEDYHISADVLPKHGSPDSGEVLVDPDVSEGAGVPESQGVACLNPSGIGCGIQFRPASHRLIPIEFRMSSRSIGVKHRREEFLVV